MIARSFSSCARETHRTPCRNGSKTSFPAEFCVRIPAGQRRRIRTSGRSFARFCSPSFLRRFSHQSSAEEHSDGLHSRSHKLTVPKLFDFQHESLWNENAYVLSRLLRHHFGAYHIFDIGGIGKIPARLLMMSVCSECGQEIPIGGWPFCDRSKHASVYPEYAQAFSPILFDRNPLTGHISYVGASTDPVPAGYVRESLSTINQVDQFCRNRSDEETAKHRDQIRHEKEYWDNRVKERRAFVVEEMKRRGFKGRGFDAVTRFLDARREAKYSKLLNKEVHFFSDVFSFDSSNREAHSSEETGWRNRKA